MEEFSGLLLFVLAGLVIRQFRLALSKRAVPTIDEAIQRIFAGMGLFSLASFITAVSYGHEWGGWLMLLGCICALAYLHLVQDYHRINCTDKEEPGPLLR